MQTQGRKQNEEACVFPIYIKGFSDPFSRGYEDIDNRSYGI